jgi:hypothetical protein
MRVVTLGAPLQVIVPFLGVASLSRSTRGVTLLPGGGGATVGGALIAASAGLGYGLYELTGLLGVILAAWLLGTSGVVTLYASIRPLAFVKPICTRCRLLPIIKEHEAIHLTGVASEKAVWESMKTRHSVVSLGLEGDPAICSFCPIPKRLSEH